MKPVFELYGEVLLELGRADDAVDKFEASLLRTPNRPLSLLGLARSHQAAGNRPAAVASYRKLLEIWTGRDLPSVTEAKAYLEASDT